MTHSAEPDKGVKGNGKGLHRRKFLGGMAGVGLGAVAVAGASFSLLTEGTRSKAAAADGTLTVPDLLEGTASDGTTTYTLEARTGTGEVLGGVTSTTAGYNQSYLGPTMKWTTGDTVLLNITNSLGDDTTVHFPSGTTRTPWAPQPSRSSTVSPG